MAFRNQLTSISIKGFKSIQWLEKFEPGPLNILIGANGAGKSNFIAFFRMMNWMTRGELQLEVATHGGAGRFFFGGPQVTREIEGAISVETENGQNEYEFRLGYASKDTLVFLQERARFNSRNKPSHAWTEFDAGHRESRLIEASRGGREPGAKVIRFIFSLLKGCQVYQFHNTSDRSRFKQKWLVTDKWELKEDGGNIAPVLLRLREAEPDCYAQIVSHCRRLLPFFNDFELTPDGEYILLQWRETGSDLILDASAASDGMLRIFALLTLLCQPEDRFPDALFIDEPELGLHPSAIELVAGLLRSISHHTQVFVATQSPGFLSLFSPSDVTVVERDPLKSSFVRQSDEDLAAWLEEYSLGEVWQMNLIGGRPR